MNLQEKVDLVKQVGEEIVTEEELLELLKTKEHPIAYDGFEPSGKIHIAQGLLRAINVNKLTKAGIKFKFWVADWFALMNNKLGGDLEKIKVVGEYFIEVWKASGMDMKNVEFLWASDVMNDSAYWLKVITIGRLNTVTRITRCSQIMGREETDALSAAQIFYPCMQCADIFHLGADITQLGMDQRKVNMLAREVALKMGYKKPVVVSHHMLMGLGEPPKSDLQGKERAIALKMSKSKPDTCIFMTDSEEEIVRKFKKAYCPEKQVQDNPILEYCKYIVFERMNSLTILRPEKYGGNVTFISYDELENAFVDGNVHPADLKTATARAINELLIPVRDYFENNAKAKKLKLLVESYDVTR
ncbi:TPA: tyrosine--tRNA ligase [Candidatus Woesearchaeota archaeon]|nr:tyrosine--tRNA ligase [Candidatus Woesearchaeota archaeon]